MMTSAHIAKHFRDVQSGGNWTCVNLRDTLSDVSWEQACRKIEGFNTIAALTYHIHYYVHAVLAVLEGRALEAHDKYSYDHPPLNSEQDWQELLDLSRKDAEAFAALVEQLPDDKLWESMAGEKYGSWYRNLQGIIEHTHYHLGQIVILKKMLLRTRSGGEY